jgi:hypothetical protein
MSMNFNTTADVVLTPVPQGKVPILATESLGTMAAPSANFFHL